MWRGATTSNWRWPVAIALVVSLAPLLACAGRRPAEEAPSRQPAATPILVATPTPAPTPTPVPPSLACTTVEDCTLTPYPRPVLSAAGCYCPTCPQHRNAAAAAANEESWQRLCGAAWAERAACEAPMCPRPAAPGCFDGACRSGFSEPAVGAPPG